MSNIRGDVGLLYIRAIEIEPLRSDQQYYGNKVIYSCI